MHRVGSVLVPMLVFLLVNNSFSAVSASAGVASDPPSNVTTQRNERFLSLFSVVRFSNDECYSSSNYTGTCMTSAECSSESGTASGSCASGFGVCCVFILKTCGSTGSRNCTYIQNPSTLSSTQTCMYIINKCGSDVCQIRLDYYTLSIAAPTSDTSACDDDKFVVTGASTTAPTICGQYNSGQHIYLDVTSSSSIKLNFILSSASTSTSRNWNIKVTQLPCNSLITAPANCLQYFTDLSGTVRSFNYDTGTPANSRHLANQDYEICFRMENNYCSICYTVCNTPTSSSKTSFVISGPAGMSSTNKDCPKDYVIIPGAYNQGFGSDTTMFADRLCGQFFNANNDEIQTANSVVCTSRKPFRFHFYTDSGLTEDTDPEDTAEVGFCLKYNQSPC